jgi:hypothetical protein
VTPRVYQLIVGSRFQGNHQQAVSIAWHGEKFARLKKLRALEKYLKPDAKPTPDEGAADLRGMIARMKARKESKHGAR